MPNYRRLRRRGGTYFFTVVTHRRRQFLVDPLARRCLHEAIEQMVRRSTDTPYFASAYRTCSAPGRDALPLLATLVPGPMTRRSRRRSD